MKLSIERALIESSVSVDSAVAQERPMGAMLIYAGPIDIGDDNFFPINRTFGDDFTVRSTKKTLSPKFDPVAAGRLFVANAIRHGNVTTIRNCMAALDRFPR